MKQEFIKRSAKNIMYGKVDGYLVRVERCKPGVSALRFARDIASVLFIAAAWLVLLFF